MVVSLQSIQPIDYSVIAVSGLATIASLAAFLYTIPWRRATGSSLRASTDFNVLWRSRAVLCLLSALLASLDLFQPMQHCMQFRTVPDAVSAAEHSRNALLAHALQLSQLLRVSSIWGPNSLIFSDGVTSWTGAGWMLYLTVALGVLQPLCAFTTLLMLATALSRRHRPMEERHPNARLLGLALLCMLPVAAAQAAISWVSLAVSCSGQQLEQQPRTVLGYFFAVYWWGSSSLGQCGSSTVAAEGWGGAGTPATEGQGDPPPQGLLASRAVHPDATQQGGVHLLGSQLPQVEPAEAQGGGYHWGGQCTLCVFPAASVAAQALFCAAVLLGLGVASNRLAAAVLNKRLRRRVRLFQLACSLLLLAGLGAMGASVAWSPFTWVNQGCWAGYVASLALTVLLVEWGMVVAPMHDLRSADKHLALWSGSLPSGAYVAPCSTGLTVLAAQQQQRQQQQLQAAPGLAIRASSAGQDGGSPSVVVMKACSRSTEQERAPVAAPTVLGSAAAGSVSRQQLLAVHAPGSVAGQPG